MTESTSETSLSVIIVNWNACALLCACIQSLHDHCNDLIEIIVVDNASTDDSVEVIKSRFSDVKLIVNRTNVGFAAANNQAISIANGRLLLLLNPDTLVLSGSINALIDYAESHPETGAVGPRLQNPDGSLQRSCWRGYPGLLAALVDAFYLWKLPRLPLVNRSEYKLAELSETREVDHLLGACMLIPRGSWERVGPLDVGYFMYLEETDWCRRAKARGHPIVYLPCVGVIHFGQHSSRQKPSHSIVQYYQSYYRFYRKSADASSFGLLLLKSVFVLAALTRIILWGLRRFRTRDEKRQSQARAMLRGYLHLLSKIPSL